MPTLWDQPFTQQPAPSNPSSAAGNLYYQPGSTYGAETSWSDTPLSGIIREQNQQLAYSQYGQNMGIAENQTPFSRWFYQQFPTFQRGYGLATLQNPLINVDEYTATLPGIEAIMSAFQRQSPQARGLNYNAYAPQVRWLGR